MGRARTVAASLNIMKALVLCLGESFSLYSFGTIYLNSLSRPTFKFIFERLFFVSQNLNFFLALCDLILIPMKVFVNHFRPFFDKVVKQELMLVSISYCIFSNKFRVRFI